MPTLTASAHYEPQDRVVPFVVGRLCERRGFVHVIDDFALDVLLRTLDTVADLARYFEAKEQLVAGDHLAYAAGEEDLLAEYLRSRGSDGLHGFTLPAEREVKLYIAPGIWEGFRKHPDRLAQIAADQVSYAWDRLVDEFAHHMLKGDQHFASHPSLPDQERALRVMAGESRHSRRQLAKFLIGVLHRGDEYDYFARMTFRTGPAELCYVFLSFKPPRDKPYEAYRDLRRYWLESYCLAAKLKHRRARIIVGIATEPAGHVGLRSEDYAYLDATEWNEEMELEARRRQEEFGFWLSATPERRYDEPEYPRIRDLKMDRGRNRNKACPCGSGLKYKRCCGRRDRDENAPWTSP